MKKNFLDTMLNVDRRVIFLLIGISVIVPLFTTYKQEIKPDEAATQFYQKLEELKAKKDSGKDVVVLFSAEYNPGTVPELSPMAKAIFTKLFRIDAKIITMGLVPTGPPLIQEELNAVLKRPEFRDKKYGRDYVNLGFTTGGVVVIKGFIKDIRDKYPVDANGTKLDDLPMMKNVTNYDDIDLIINLSSMGGGAATWIQFAEKTNGSKMDILFGCTAVMAPEAYPFLNSGQLSGLLGGLKGAADYEALIQEPDKATKYMFAQSVAHIVIMIFIIIGNVAFFIRRRKIKA